MFDAASKRPLARKQAIVSKFVAVEELACVDVLCADNTGTHPEQAVAGRCVLRAPAE